MTLKYIRQIEFIKMFFCWIKISKNTFFISAPENVYSDTNMPILRGLEAVILTRMYTCRFGRPVCTMTTTGVSKIFLLLY